MNSTNSAFTNTMLVMLGFAAIFFATGLFFSDTVTRMFGTDEAVFKMTKTYLQVILLFAPVFMLSHVLLCFIRNDGAPHLSMLAMVSSSLSNIILDIVFIFWLKMGMFGAALASGLATVISLIIISPFFIKKKNHFHLIKCAISGRLVGGIFSIGLPSLITELSFGVVMIVFNTIILGLQGNVGVAAYGVIANLSIVVLAIYTGIAQGIQPIISRNYGSSNITDVKAILRYALILMATISGAVYACVFFGAPQIVNIFNSEQNILLHNVAIVGIKIYFTSCIFAGFNIIMSVYFTSIEYTRPAHIISILRGFLIIIPMAFLLSSIGGMIGVWCAYPTTELTVAGIGFTLYLFTKGRIVRD